VGFLLTLVLNINELRNREVDFPKCVLWRELGDRARPGAFTTFSLVVKRFLIEKNHFSRRILLIYERKPSLSLLSALFKTFKSGAKICISTAK
jgi:hypothetical protein